MPDLVMHNGHPVDPVSGKVYGCEIATHVDRSGYRQVYLKKGKTIQAHRFIWEAVHGPIPDGLFINHINGNKRDNRLANLELVTHAENIRHAYRTGLASNKGDRHPGNRVGNFQVLTIRALADLGFTHTDIASRPGIPLSRRQVSLIATRRAWSHLPEHQARQEDF